MSALPQGRVMAEGGTLPAIVEHDLVVANKILTAQRDTAQAALAAEQEAHGETREKYEKELNLIGSACDKIRIQASQEGQEWMRKLGTAREEVEHLTEVNRILSDDNMAKEAELAKLSWRPVSPETMPKEVDGNVIFAFDDQSFGRFKWDRSDIAERWKDKVTFWVPLPPLPTPAVEDELEAAIKHAQASESMPINRRHFEAGWQAARAQGGKEL